MPINGVAITNIFVTLYTKCLKSQQCDVIKMKEMRGEVGKNPRNNGWTIPHFYDITWFIFESFCPHTK